MSEPGPDFSGTIAAAMAAPGLAVDTHPEYRVAPPGDPSPTSGATLRDVTEAPDTMAGQAESAIDAAGDPAPNPVDVSAMGGAINQWWVSPEDAAATQAAADQVNAATGGAAVPGSDGLDLGWQPFPPGPDGMVPQ